MALVAIRARVRLLLTTLCTSALLGSCGPTIDGTENLQVAVTVVPAVVNSGDTATVTVTLINPTGASVSVSGPNACRYAFAIYDQQGVHVGGVQPQLCAAVVGRLDLAPQASDTKAFAWTAVGVAGQPLPAGPYTVVGAALWLDGRPSAPQPLQVVDP